VHAGAGTHGRDTPCWVVSKRLVWTNYDDSDTWVAYNPDSANIHLLTASARTLWTVIEATPWSTLDELTGHFAAALGREADTEFAAATRDAVVSMDRMGLIEPIS